MHDCTDNENGEICEKRPVCSRKYCRRIHNRKEYAKMEISPEIFAIITSVLSEEAGTTPYGLNIVRIRKLSSISEKGHMYD